MLNENKTQKPTIAIVGGVSKTKITIKEMIAQNLQIKVDEESTAPKNFINVISKSYPKKTIDIPKYHTNPTNKKR